MQRFRRKSHQIAKANSFKLKDFGSVAPQILGNKRSSLGGRGWARQGANCPSCSLPPNTWWATRTPKRICARSSRRVHRSDGPAPSIAVPKHDREPRQDGKVSKILVLALHLENIAFSSDHLAGMGQSLHNSSRSRPSDVTKRIRIAISPETWVEQLKQGSYARTTAETRLSMPSSSFAPFTKCSLTC